MEAGSVDAIIADWPYGTTACSWDSVIPLDKLWPECKRVIKRNGVIVLFGSEPFSSVLRLNDLKMYKYDWVWEKGRDRIANYAMQNVMPGKIHNNILVFSLASIAYNSKIKMTYNPVGAIPVNKSKIFDYGGKKGGAHLPNRTAKKVDGIQRFTKYPVSILKMPFMGIPIHPTQKPLALLEYLVLTYTNPGDLVLDNTCGSGTTLEAAIRTGRRSIGIEKDPGYYEIAKDRLERVAAELRGDLDHLPMFAEVAA